MPEAANVESPHVLAALRSGIGADLDRRLAEHIHRLRAEVREGLGHLERGAAALGAGAGLTALGGVMGTHMVVHLLSRVTRLPLWVCYGLVAAGLGGAGAALLASGRREMADITRIAALSPAAPR